jgi:hypothetical protein
MEEEIKGEIHGAFGAFGKGTQAKLVARLLSPSVTAKSITVSDDCELTTIVFSSADDKESARSVLAAEKVNLK